ncbi:MAG: ribonuclease PH, partial [Burkholderiaceae bacterium]
TASITGCYVALADALGKLVANGTLASIPLRDSVAAVSVGMHQGRALLDLDYEEDSGCDTDLNVVMTGSGGLVEVQGTAEGVTFSREDLTAMLDLAGAGIAQLSRQQEAALLS